MPVSLLDAFTRHQLYLEGYKVGLEGHLDPVLAGMYDEVAKALARAKVEKLNQLTRKQLAALIRSIQQMQLRRNNAFRAAMLRELQAFADADLTMNRNVMQAVEGKTVEEADDGSALPLLGLLALRRNPAGRARLWAVVSNTPDPATGLKPGALVGQYLGYLSRSIQQLITQAYANGWTVRETMAAIFGTRSKRFQDGFTAKAKRQGAAMLHTVVQHVSSLVQAGVASIFYKFYEWVSVLDKFTTKICQTRDGIVYEYGKGPLPPAHFRCRSRAVPIPKGATYGTQADSFYAWLRAQPAPVQDDVAGIRVAGGLRSGRVNADGLGRFSVRQQLTLEQFVGKFVLIVLT